ncbi:MAG: hypothetical protein NZ957_06250 [Thaumarchaeota archaeon]|nr:hypothetical protein [Candidatus Calditenuaceae archaeon]MDW8042561.1 hypothetical protein [Nitrososphaerota archaeon]
MDLRIAIALFEVKVRHYLGPLLRRPKYLLSLVLMYVLWLSVTGLFSLALRFSGIASGSGSTGFLPVLSEITITAVLATGIYLGIKGGITAFPYEIDFVLASQVKARVFLLSDVLFQFLLLSLFILPPVSLMISTLTYPVHIDYLIRGLSSYVIAISAAILLSHVLGLSRVILGDRGSRALGWALMAVFLMPLILLALRVPKPDAVRYHPAVILSNAIRGEVADLYLVVPYIILLTFIYVHLSRANFYPSVTPVLISALMEQPTKISRYIRFPTSVMRGVGLKTSGGLTSLMYVLHLMRVVREGSLLTGMTVLVFLTLGNVAMPRMMGLFQFSELAQLTIIALYVPLLPALLSINWNISERKNVWVVRLSPGSERNYLTGLVLTYLTVTFPFSLLLYGLVALGSSELPFLAVDLILLFAMSYFGSALATLTSLLVRVGSSPLSLGSMVFIAVPLIGSILLSLPILMIRTFEPLASSPTPALMANMLIYTGISTLVLYKALVSGGVRYLTQHPP